MAKLSTDQLIDAFKELTLIELSEFVSQFEEVFGVTAAAPVAVAAATFLATRFLCCDCSRCCLTRRAEEDTLVGSVNRSDVNSPLPSEIDFNPRNTCESDGTPNAPFAFSVNSPSQTLALAIQELASYLDCIILVALTAQNSDGLTSW